MAIIDHLPQLAGALDVRGTVTLFDPDTGAPTGRAVLQKSSQANASIITAGGVPLMLRAYVIPHDPQTLPQRGRRALLAAAVAAYQADPAACRLAAAPLAERRGITPYQAWCSLYLASHTPHTGTAWDGGATIWDEGASAFDAT